ncbi:MAG: hypothetical protein QXS54_02985 [Candidatus Methanomethylicaceae archaeon]
MTMLIVNQYNLTVAIDESSPVQTTAGEIPYSEWCAREVERLKRAGIAAKVRRRKCHNGRHVCWVVRDGRGIRPVEGDEPDCI